MTYKSFLNLKWVGGGLFFLLASYGVCFAAESKRPNVVFILVDDMGWSDLGILGGDIETPNIDRLAKEGTFFPHFLNHAKCESSRSSLMTGVHFQRQTHDHVTREFNNVTTIASVLQDEGYYTASVGKWHLPDEPTDHGFDRFFGLVQGAANHFDPDGRLNLDERYYLHKGYSYNGEPVALTGEDFYSTDAFTDYALRFLEERPEKKPFFLYLAYTAPHWPLQAPDSSIQKYKGRYSEGWDRLREKRYEHLIESGFLSTNFKRSERDPNVLAWNELSPEQQANAAQCMEVHAAMVDRLDEQIGRVIDYLEQMGELDNTLICFASDNGVSAEIRFDRTPEKPAGPVDSFRTLPLGFCNAVNTPFQKYKASNANGGICSPFIAFWPGRIEAGRVEEQAINILDMMPTLLDVATADYPEGLRPLDRKSILPQLLGESAESTDDMYFRMKYASVDQKAIVRWPWKAWYNGKEGWSLYRLDRDWAETENLKSNNPEQLSVLIHAYAAFEAETQGE